MDDADPREVVLAFLTAPAFVTAQTKGPDVWVASTGGGGLDAPPESVVVVKERHLPKRAAYNVRFTTRTGMRMRYTVSLGEVLFPSDDVVQTPLEVELYDSAGNLIGRQTACAF
jgi:hypothetical protein